MAPRDVCTATLYERKFLVWYAPKWTAPLSNRVAPVSALVSDSGRYVVTFDNWDQVGYGDDVVAVYDGSNGTLLWKYRLEVPAGGLGGSMRWTKEETGSFSTR